MSATQIQEGLTALRNGDATGDPGPPPPELQRLLHAAHGNQWAMDGFARVNAGVTSPAEFFSEENAGRILAAAR